VERRDDTPGAIDDARPFEAPGLDEPNPARDALRATPNQHSFDDEEPDDDAARNYHGVDDGR
jgi:hypothetical protein